MRKKRFIIVPFVFFFILGAGFLLYNKVIFANETEEFKISIDPGHQKKGVNLLEPNAPGSSVRKPKVSSGTRGVNSKKWEYETNLNCSLILKDLLEKENLNVYLTRESNDVNISNSERAILANSQKVDISIKIHCDSIGNSSKQGASILVPSKNSKYTKNIYDKSYEFALCLSESLKEKGIKVNGIFERNDLTGFNWSKVPVVTLEMGFMSNPEEDRLLNTKEYQNKLMIATKDAILKYKNNKIIN